MRALFVMVAVVLGGCSNQPAPTSARKQTRQAACGQASDETVRIMQGLAPTCAGCHTSGTRAFFNSVSAFQDLVVANPELIVPGDPDASQFVKLLEARGTGSFPQMPIGLKTYADLLADGTATISLDAIKDWVRGLGTQGRGSEPDPDIARVNRLKPEQVQRALYQQLGLEHADFFIDAREYGIVMAESRGDDLYPFQPNDAVPAPRQQATADRFQGLGGGNTYAQRRSDLSISPSFALTLTQISQRWCRLGLAKAGNQALFPAGTTKATDAANVKATISRWFTHFHGVKADTAQVDELYGKVWQPLSTDSEAAWVGLCSAFIRHPNWIFY